MQKNIHVEFNKGLHGNTQCTQKQYLLQFLLRRAATEMLYSHERMPVICPSVRPTVCLSVCQTHALSQKEINLCPYSRKIDASSFATRRMTGARCRDSKTVIYLTRQEYVTVEQT